MRLAIVAADAEDDGIQPLDGNRRPDGRILKDWPKFTKAEEHPQEVLDYLAGLKI